MGILIAAPMHFNIQGLKADSVYPGYSGNPEDMMEIRRIHRIYRKSRGYIGNPNDSE